MSTEPVTITILRSGFSVPDIDERKYSANRTAYRGEVVTLTPEQVEGTRDLNGNSWTTLTEEQQLARWGHVNFALGDQREAEGIKFVGDDDEAQVHRFRERATAEADKISDPQARRAAHAAITERFGASQGTQRTLQAWER